MDILADERQPTLAEKILYIDLFFAAPSEARDELVAAGKVRRWYQHDREHEHDAEFQADKRIIGDYAARLIGERTYDAGLPYSVCSTERVRSAYLDRMAEVGAPVAAVRSTYGMAAA